MIKYIRPQDSGISKIVTVEQITGFYDRDRTNSISSISSMFNGILEAVGYELLYYYMYEGVGYMSTFEQYSSIININQYD